MHSWLSQWVPWTPKRSSDDMPVDGGGLALTGRIQSHPLVALPTLLPLHQQSGLNVTKKILQNVEDISFCTLSQADVVRNPLVQGIVAAYESHDK